MEKEKNKGLIVSLIIFIILTLVLGGYIVYDKVLSNEETAKVDDTPNVQEEIKENNTILKNEVGQVLNSIYGTFVVDTDGSVYFKPTEKVTNLGVETPFKKETSLGTTNTYQTKVYETGPSVYTFEGYKLDLTNIVSGYEVYVGNGGFKNVYFIDQRGDVYRVNFSGYESGIIDYSNIEKLTEYSNIVSIVETHSFGGYSAVFIDKNNKQYK